MGWQEREISKRNRDRERQQRFGKELLLHKESVGRYWLKIAEANNRLQPAIKAGYYGRYLKAVQVFEILDGSGRMNWEYPYCYIDLGDFGVVRSFGGVLVVDVHPGRITADSLYVVDESDMDSLLKYLCDGDNEALRGRMKKAGFKLKREYLEAKKTGFRIQIRRSVSSRRSVLLLISVIGIWLLFIVGYFSQR